MDLPSELPLVLLATAHVHYEELDREAAARFVETSSACYTHCGCQVHHVVFCTTSAKHDTTSTPHALPDTGRCDGGSHSRGPRATPPKRAPCPPSTPAPGAKEAQEQAAKAAAEAQLRAEYEADQMTLRLLRMALRDITVQLLSERRWKDFVAPADPEEHLEYWENVQHPMDLATLLARVDARQYGTAAAYLADVELIVQVRLWQVHVCWRPVQAVIYDPPFLVVLQMPLPPHRSAGMHQLAITCMLLCGHSHTQLTEKKSSSSCKLGTSLNHVAVLHLLVAVRGRVLWHGGPWSKVFCQSLCTAGEP